MFIVSAKFDPKKVIRWAVLAGVLLIAAIVRGGHAIIPNGNDMILEGDRVIVVARSLFLQDLNDIMKK